MVKRFSWAGFAALVAAASLGTGYALAGTFVSGHVYNNGNLCVQNDLYFSGENAYVTVHSLTDQLVSFPTIQCRWARNVPYPYLAAMWQSFKYVWNPYGNWVLCGQQGYEYGSGNQMTVGRGLVGCGSAWYFARSGAYVRNGDTFYGGWVQMQSSVWINY